VTPAALRKIDDPIARAKAAMRELEAISAQRAEMLAVRDQAIVEATKVHPWSLGDVATALGSLTKARVAQIVAAAKAEAADG